MGVASLILFKEIKMNWFVYGILLGSIYNHSSNQTSYVPYLDRYDETCTMLLKEIKHFQIMSKALKISNPKYSNFF
jgi:hypothetical protein